MRPLHLALLVFAIGTPNALTALVTGNGFGTDVLSQAPISDPWTKKSIRPDQAWLLETAYSAASAFPLNPHIKNRSRAQEAVVVAAFQLDQPSLAHRYAKGIANWRRGAAIADVAAYAAQHELDVSVQEIMDEALEVVAEHDQGSDQVWRKERILTKLGQVHEILASDGSSSFAELTDEEFIARLDSLDQVLLAGVFEEVQAALHTLAGAYGDVFQQAERRDAIEAKIMESRGKMPRLVHIQVGFTLVDQANKHGDYERALRLLSETNTIFTGGQWLLEDKLPLLARMAALRFEAGDKKVALSEAQGAWLAYEAERETIVDIQRADALIPLAEAFVAMGDSDRARELYARALEEGMHNPNSRPRTDDLVATCVSMAVHGVEPGEAFVARVTEIHAGLGVPW